MDGQPEKKKFAVFDIDGTVMRTSAMQLLSRELVGSGRLGAHVGHEINVRLHDYRQRIRDVDFGAYMADAVKIMFSDLKELDVAEYNRVCEALAAKSAANTYVYTRELLRNMKRHGYFLIAISGSELSLVQAFGNALGFDVSIGSAFYGENEDGKLTGDVEVIHHPKSDILNALIEKFGLSMSNSLAVGDTTSDIPVLEMVEQAIAFNPNRELFTYARSKGWLVVVERKDMVYGLELEDGKYTLSTTNA